MTAVTDLWMTALQSAWGLARGERLNELDPEGRVRRFDERGLHPYSHVVGQVHACQELVPVLREAQFDPVEFRRTARSVAYEEFVKGLAA